MTINKCSRTQQKIDLKYKKIPTKYDQALIQKFYDLALLGLTDRQIQQYLDIDSCTYNRWLHDYVDLKSALVRGRIGADTAVAKTAYNLALGRVKHQKIATEYDAIGNVIKRTVQEEIIPPNQKSVEFWLKSRQSQVWGDKSTIDVNLSFEKILKLADTDDKTDINDNIIEL